MGSSTKKKKNNWAPHFQVLSLLWPPQYHSERNCEILIQKPRLPTTVILIHTLAGCGRLTPGQYPLWASQCASHPFWTNSVSLCYEGTSPDIERLEGLKEGSSEEEEGARRQNDGGEKMAHAGGAKNAVPRCCTTTSSISKRQNYHSGQKLRRQPNTPRHTRPTSFTAKYPHIHSETQS